MSERGRPAVRALVIAAGLVVGVASLFTFRSQDWPIYLTFFFLSGVLFLPGVEVMPRVQLGIAELAATFGFLYIAGPPILVLRLFSPIITRLMRQKIPARWVESLPPFPAFHFFDVLFADGKERVRLLAEWSTFALGLGVRWVVASSLSPSAPPVTDPAVILIAEICGYATLGLLSGLPIYPDRPLMPAEEDSLRSRVSRGDGETTTALSDMTLIVALALTPFVFLIDYGYQLHGLGGATGWAIGALGLHFVLKRLHERRLRLEEQNRRLEALNRELEHRERLSAIGKMSSIVSHQILQQLGVIGLHADLIRNAGDDEPKTELERARSNAAAIEGALGDVNKVLTDLLVFSRDLRLNLYEHSLDRVVREAVEECRRDANRRGVLLKVRGSEDASIVIDKLKIKQALVNVIRNAVDASPPGGRVEVGAAATDTHATIAVSDTGPGVVEAQRETIFAPFFTTKEHGTGLGLAITRVFVEAHGGKVSVDRAAANGGARFTIELPRSRASAGVGAHSQP
jgi:signal transduction histidine kinase